MTFFVYRVSLCLTASHLTAQPHGSTSVKTSVNPLYIQILVWQDCNPMWFPAVAVVANLPQSSTCSSSFWNIQISPAGISNHATKSLRSFPCSDVNTNKCSFPFCAIFLLCHFSIHPFLLYWKAPHRVAGNLEPILGDGRLYRGWCANPL